MDICSFDWELASKFIPSIITATIAIIIFWQWRTQKGSEVIAKEARELIIHLSKLASVESTMSNLIYKNHIKDLSNEFKKYKELKEQTSDSFTFFSMCIQDDPTTRYYLSEYLASCINFIKEIDQYITDKDSFDDRKYTNSNALFEANKLLLNYSLYKKRSLKSRFLTKVKGYHHT